MEKKGEGEKEQLKIVLFILYKHWEIDYLL